MSTDSIKAIELVEEIMRGSVESLSEEELVLLNTHAKECARKVLERLVYEVSKIQAGEVFSPSALRYSLQLSAFFEETRAFDWICQLHLYEEVWQESLGEEFIQNHWALILSATVGKEYEKIQLEIENVALEEEIRSSAVDSLAILVAKEKLERKSVIAYFKKLYQKILSGEIEEPLLITGLVESTIDLWPGECLEEIRELYGLGLVDEEYLSLSVVLDGYMCGLEECLAGLKEWVDTSHPLDPLVPSVLFGEGEFDEIAGEFAEELSQAKEQVELSWKEEGFEEEVQEGNDVLVYFAIEEGENGEKIEIPHFVAGSIEDIDIDSFSKKEQKKYYSLYEHARSKPEKALEIIQELLVSHPKVPALLNCLYDVHRLLDRRQDAIGALKELVEIAPKYLPGQIEYAAYLLRRGEPEKVSALFGHAFTLSRLCPKRKFFHVMEWLRFIHVIGWYFIQIGMIDQAKQYLAVLHHHAKHSEEYRDLKAKIHNELLLNSLDNELQSLE